VGRRVSRSEIVRRVRSRHPSASLPAAQNLCRKKLVADPCEVQQGPGEGVVLALGVDRRHVCSARPLPYHPAATQMIGGRQL
jgi:hypothetical protein